MKGSHSSLCLLPPRSLSPTPFSLEQLGPHPFTGAPISATHQPHRKTLAEPGSSRTLEQVLAPPRGTRRNQAVEKNSTRPEKARVAPPFADPKANLPQAAGTASNVETTVAAAIGPCVHTAAIEKHANEPPIPRHIPLIGTFKQIFAGVWKRARGIAFKLELNLPQRAVHRARRELPDRLPSRQTSSLHSGHRNQKD